MKEQQTNEFYEFGGFRLDLRTRRLLRNDEIVALTPKEFELLLLLVENAGQIVGKDELMEKLWEDTFVEEGTLTRNVSWLRKKLAAFDGNTQRFIETIPKRGYRFLPEVRINDGDDDRLVIEEQTVRHLLITETVALAPTEENPLEFQTTQPVAPPQLASPTKRRNLGMWVVFFSGCVVLITIALAGSLNFFRKPAPKTILVNKVTPFSGLTGRETMPAFSPDGKQIAFSWNGGEEKDNFDIYIKLIGAGEPVRLTRNQADDISPAFAPDGRTIAFVRVLLTHSELFLIPALGGAERKICDLRHNYSAVSFSPDGRVLAVHDGDVSGRNGIFLISVENGEKRRLSAPPELAIDDRPAFARDGKSVAFVRGFAQNVQEVFVVSSDGGEPRQLTFDKARLGGIAWCPDGERIVFASQRKYNSQANLWQITTSGSEQPELIATSSKKLGNLAVSPDGRTIAFVEELYDTNIWRIRPAQLPERGAFRKFAPSSRNDNSPNISPDGSRVVFASSRTGNYEIWIADVDGSNVRQLTDLPKAQAGSPRFSPDGKWIVFDAQIEGNGDIFIVSANGGASRRLTDSAAFDFMPAWSANGNSIYFASNRSSSAQIYKMPVAGGEARQITRNGGSESYESPDGKHLFYRKGESSAALWRISSEGGEEEIVPELAEAGYWRYWTVTKTGIYFVRRSEYSPYKIMFYDFSSNRTREITTTQNSPIWTYPGLGVSEDGKTILFAQADQNAGSIMLAELTGGIEQ